MGLYSESDLAAHFLWTQWRRRGWLHSKEYWRVVIALVHRSHIQVGFEVVAWFLGGPGLLSMSPDCISSDASHGGDNRDWQTEKAV